MAEQEKPLSRNHSNVNGTQGIKRGHTGERNVRNAYELVKGDVVPLPDKLLTPNELFEMFFNSLPPEYRNLPHEELLRMYNAVSPSRSVIPFQSSQPARGIVPGNITSEDSTTYVTGTLSYPEESSEKSSWTTRRTFLTGMAVTATALFTVKLLETSSQKTLPPAWVLNWSSDTQKKLDFAKFALREGQAALYIGNIPGAADISRNQNQINTYLDEYSPKPVIETPTPRVGVVTNLQKSLLYGCLITQDPNGSQKATVYRNLYIIDTTDAGQIGAFINSVAPEEYVTPIEYNTQNFTF